MRNTNFLFATPSFIRGISKMFDIGATSMNYYAHIVNEEADLKVLESDWENIGIDIRRQ